MAGKSRWKPQAHPPHRSDQPPRIMAQEIILTPPSVSPFSSSTERTDLHQNQLLEKLKQLRLWQQQQQEQLLLQQQKELINLRAEQDCIRKQLSLNKSHTASTCVNFNSDVLPEEPYSQSDVSSQLMSCNSLQPVGHTVSGSSLSSTQSADSGLLSAQSSAVDVLKKPYSSETDESSGFHTPSSDVIIESETEEVQESNDEIDEVLISHDDQPVRPGIGPGSAATFEELLEKKLKQYECTTYYHLPLQPTLFRCPSEDSFLVRKEQRKQKEEAELVEFELLERAAQETSFSSQCSIVARAIIHGDTHHMSSPKLANIKRNREGRSLSLSPVERRSITPHTQYHSENLPFHSISESNANAVVPSTTPFTLPSVKEDNEDLNSTLTSHQTFEDDDDSSVHDCLEFKDTEAWDSFSNNDTLKSEVQPQHSPFTTRDSPFKANNDSINTNNMLPVKSNAPIRKVKILPAAAVFNDSSSSESSDNETESLENVVSELPILPPPSSLVAKLFPVLKKQRDTRQDKDENKLVSNTKQNTGLSHVDHSPVDPSINNTLNEQVKEKLMQLEKEINKFKSENATLEKMRIEKEQGLLRLRKEVMKFENEKEQEIANFEKYKQDEIKKLKKERKIFETYQKEFKTERSKKDKEEIAALKQELDAVRDELHTKEARWSSTLSRYRLRIDSLEAQNKELQNDLKMMEEQRLIQWQKQLENKSPQNRNSTRKPIKSSPQDNKTKKLNESHNKKEMYQFGSKSKEKSTQKVRFSKVTSTSSNKENEKPKDISSKTNKPSNKKPLQPTHNTNEKLLTEPKSQNTDSSSDSDDDDILISNDGSKLCAVTERKSSEESDCVIIEVQAVDMESDSELSDKANDIVSEVLLTHEANEDYNPSTENDDPKTFQFNTVSHYEEMQHPFATCHENTNTNVKETTKEEDGSKVILYSNGTKKVVSADGLISTVYFFNGDIKRMESNGTIVYYYSNNNTTHTAQPDGVEVWQFTNGQLEYHYPNGCKDINFPDGTVKHILLHGEEKIEFADGNIQHTFANGDRTIEFPDGRRDIHTKEYKRREFPDGTIKTVYPDGHQETQYVNGRVRVKDKNGQVLVDTVRQPL